VSVVVVVRKGKKKFLVETSLQPFLLSTNVLVSTAFFKVQTTSSVVHRFRFRTTHHALFCPA
jgi:hypothetical protein